MAGITPTAGKPAEVVKSAGAPRLSSGLVPLLLVIACAAVGCQGPRSSTGEETHDMTVDWRGGVRHWELRDLETGEVWRGSDADDR
jgi:hypothetical protein